MEVENFFEKCKSEREREKNMKKNNPLKHFFVYTLPNNYYNIMFHLNPNSIWNSIRRRLFDRYDIIKLRSFSPWLYYDKDYQLEEACFQILIDFVEIECFGMYKICFPQNVTFLEGLRKRSPDHGLSYLHEHSELNEHSQEGYQELIDTYNKIMWIREEEKAQKNRINGALCSEDKMDEYHYTEEFLIQKKTEILETIIKHRHLLWT